MEKQQKINFNHSTQNSSIWDNLRHLSQTLSSTTFNAPIHRDMIPLEASQDVNSLRNKWILVCWFGFIFLPSDFQSPIPPPFPHNDHVSSRSPHLYYFVYSSERPSLPSSLPQHPQLFPFWKSQNKTKPPETKIPTSSRRYAEALVNIASPHINASPQLAHGTPHTPPHSPIKMCGQTQHSRYHFKHQIYPTPKGMGPNWSFSTPWKCLGLKMWPQIGF